MLKKGNCAQRASASAPSELLPSPTSNVLTLPLVYIAAVLKYLAADNVAATHTLSRLGARVKRVSKLS